MRKLCLLSCLLLPASVFGAPLNYTLNYRLTSNSDVITFSLPRLPTPLDSCAYSSDCFSVTPTNLVIDGDSVSNGTVSFYEPSTGGGITIMQGDTLVVNNDGPNGLQLFSGTLSEPDLIGFSNLQLLEEHIGSPALDEAFLLNISAPEPGTLKLLFLACLVPAALLGGRAALRRKTLGGSNQSV
jgi:hypothetical protein